MRVRLGEFVLLGTQARQAKTKMLEAGIWMIPSALSGVVSLNFVR
jgi:hypothetical protein